MRDREDYGRPSGRRAVELRKRRLARERLCRHCAERGITTPATTPDHIVPLSQGGADVDDNIQCLCSGCHSIKTAVDGASSKGAANHPDWLKRSAVALTIVCGPPASGKTTYVGNHAAPTDTVIDLDTIMRSLRPGYEHWTEALDRDLLNRAIRVRNAMLGSLSKQRQGSAWFIVAAPTADERRWWQSKLGGEIVLLDPGPAECRRRAVARGTPRAVAGIEAWYRSSRQPWARAGGGKRLAKGCAADGRPLDPAHPWA